jgi:hypothetical protein
MRSATSLLAWFGARGGGRLGHGLARGSARGAGEALWPPQGRFVEVEGRRVHAVTRGQGPDLVLIHGASGNVRDMTFDSWTGWPTATG